MPVSLSTDDDPGANSRAEPHDGLVPSAAAGHSVDPAPKVRIAFFGNVANNFYQLAKALRRWPDMDAHLYLDAGDASQNSPENDDPELGKKYPDWIHRVPRARLDEKLLPWRRKLVREFARYDIVVVSGGGPMFANYSGRPVVFFATGGDITMAPFPTEFSFLHHGLVAKLKCYWFGNLQKRGIRRCSHLWILPFPPLLHGFRKLGIPEDRITASFCPLVIDTERFVEDPEPLKSGVHAVQEILSRFDFSVFHPSRLLMKVAPSMRSAGQWKGNDILIRAFAMFIERSKAKRAGLVLIERPEDIVEAPDALAAKNLIRDLGIEQNVLWLKPPNGSGFTRSELVAIYSACDVAAGDFGAGWFGSITLEGLALSRPVIGYVDERAMKQMYSWHPLLSSNTVEGNAELIMKLSSDPEFRRERGAAGRRWVEEFHAPASAGAMYAQRLRDMASRARDAQR